MTTTSSSAGSPRGQPNVLPKAREHGSEVLTTATTQSRSPTTGTRGIRQRTRGGTLPSIRPANWSPNALQLLWCCSGPCHREAQPSRAARSCSGSEVPHNASWAPPEQPYPCPTSAMWRVLPSKPIVTVSFVRTPSLSMADAWPASAGGNGDKPGLNIGPHDTAVFSCPAKG